jgi:hypothetical protein
LLLLSAGTAGERERQLLLSSKAALRQADEIYYRMSDPSAAVAGRDP